MLHYLNQNLTVEECRQIDKAKADNLKSAIDELRKNAETLPPELRSKYMAACMPIIASLLL